MGNYSKCPNCGRKAEVDYFTVCYSGPGTVKQWSEIAVKRHNYRIMFYPETTACLYVLPLILTIIDNLLEKHILNSIPQCDIL